jgi:hypothetical protein
LLVAAVLTPLSVPWTLAHRPPERAKGVVAVSCAVELGLGALFGLASGSIGWAVWWLVERRTQRAVVGFAVRALLGALRELDAEGPDAVRVRRCLELCAAVARLVDEA